MVDIRELIAAFTRIEKAKEEPPGTRFARVEIALDEAEYVGNAIPLHLYGDYIGKIKYTGSATGCYFKLDDIRSAKIYPSEFRRTYIEFKEVYLWNPTSQSGKKLIINIGGAFSGEVEPTSGQVVGLTDSDGVNINPVREERFKSHTYKHIKPTTMTTANTAQPLIATSTPVRWAIIHIQSKVALIGDNTVTRGGGAADGQSYAEGSYITVEFCDLNEIYVINSVLDEQVIYSITYVEEAS